MTNEEQFKQFLDADKRLQERIGAIAESIELMRLDTQHWREEQKRHEAQTKRQEQRMLRAIVAYLRPEEETGGNGHEG